MFNELPTDPQTAYDWTWEKYEPYFDDLMSRELTEETVTAWLADWTTIAKLLYEVYTRLYIATTVDTTDEEGQALYFQFLDNVAEQMEAAGDQLQRKLLDSGLTPDGFAVPMRSMRGSVAMFREENLPIKTKLNKLGKEYDAIAGAQTVEWEGEEKTLTQMKVMLMDADRDKRERVWRAIYERQLEDREALNDLWQQMLALRLELAENADKKDFREYMWIERERYDYTPEDDLRFLDSIEEVVVPAVTRLLEKRKQAMGLETLRPWDMHVDTTGDAPLKPFEDAETLIETGSDIFAQVDPELHAFYADMQQHGLLDLDNRKGKAPGGYCTGLPLTGHSFIFMNAVGTHDDVQTLLHESGHAFHNYEAQPLPYVQQHNYPTEFAEVASMSMELLAGDYLTADKGGFYTATEAARARIEHLEGIIAFWPYMLVVDAFQHWVYTNPADALDPDKCDAEWDALWERFMPGVDWTGLEDIRRTGWHRKLHIFHIPFYYIEYGLAQLGAVQVWENSLDDAEAALSQYRRALALGNTRPLPELFGAAGAKLAFDPDTLGRGVALIEQTLEQLYAEL